MNFDLSADQEDLRDGIRALCAGRFTSERVRLGFDQEMHKELSDAGVFSLRTDGFSWADSSIAFQELGRVLVPGPLVWTHLANGAAGCEGIVTGVESWPDQSEAVANGEHRVMVEFGAQADTVLGLSNEGVVCFDAEAVRRAPQIDWPLDPLTPVSVLDKFPVGELFLGPDAAAQWRLGGAVLTSAYQVGMAQACVEIATSYALARDQFDRPIGSFQAIKHLLADMAVRAEVARAAVDAAAVTLDDLLTQDSAILSEVVRPVAGARVLAGEAALANAKGSLQVHGGMGFTWEMDVHLYLKRAWMLNTVFGTPTQHADFLAATLTTTSG